jgi:hypothetical protein
MKRFAVIFLLLAAPSFAVASTPAAETPRELGRQAHAVKRSGRLERIALHRSYKAAKLETRAAELKRLNAMDGETKTK